MGNIGTTARRWAVLVAVLLIGQASWGQSITRFSVPTSMCAGDSTIVSFGYDFSYNHNVVVGLEESTLGHSERIFLPDGVPCGNLGCSYRSPVNFTAFAPGATVTSVQDIKYVRINMEHSYIGDIYINITCPNGQKANIMRFGGVNTAQCHSAIPSSATDWLSGGGGNMYESNYFGMPYDYENSTYKCDSTASGNEPGTGWNYCWSNNTTSGYQYAHASASDDGIIYRSGHEHNGRVDSSNVAAHTNFYHPDQNFSSLIGCPLNGLWYIEVVDGYSLDNGYIFEWELSLNAALIPTNDCVVDSFTVEGYGVRRLTDSTFSIKAPDAVTHDSTAVYTYRVYSSCGTIADTTATITFHPNVTSTHRTDGCTRVTWGGHTYYTDTNVSVTAQTRYGCDSLHTETLVIHPAYNLRQSESIVENELPHTFMGRTFHGPVTDTLLTGHTMYGCDSNVIYTLTVYSNYLTELADTICADALPYLWHGHTLTESTTDSVMLTSIRGADSLVVLTLTVLPTSSTEITVEEVENRLPVSFMGESFRHSVDTAFHLTNQYGCDSTIYYRLTVYMNHSYRYENNVCDNQLPYSWQGVTFDADGTDTLHLTDVHGADSTVILTLVVHPTYYVPVDTTICDNHSFYVGNIRVNTPGQQLYTLSSIYECDSVIDLDLTINPHNEQLSFDTICANEVYDFDNQEVNEPGTYTHLYENQYGCDSIISLNLSVTGMNLKAEIRAIPMIVTPANRDIRIIDVSTANNGGREWLIEGMSRSDAQFVYTFPEDADSLPLQLTAYSIEGCADTDRVVVQIDRSALATPNVFTPDKETNNRWYPAMRDIEWIEVWIYTRDGQLVAHLEGLEEAWDGTSNGNSCPQGVYVYNLKYRTNKRPEKLQTETGTILLLK